MIKHTRIKQSRRISFAGCIIAQSADLGPKSTCTQHAAASPRPPSAAPWAQLRLAESPRVALRRPQDCILQGLLQAFCTLCSRGAADQSKAARTTHVLLSSSMWCGLLLTCAVANFGGAHAQRSREFAKVVNANELKRAVLAGTKHIHITDHLDLRSLPPSKEFWQACRACKEEGWRYLLPWQPTIASVTVCDISISFVLYT